MEKPKKGAVAHNSQDISLPLLSRAFAPGTVHVVMEAMTAGDEKILAQAEYYYFTTQYEKAVEETELFFNHKDVVTKISACLIYAFSNIALGNERRAKLGFACIEEALRVEIDLEKLTLTQRAMCLLIGASVDVLMYRKAPDKRLVEHIKYLPRGLQVWACCILSQTAYLLGKIEKSIGIAETILALSTKEYPIAMAYMHISAAVSYMNLKKIDKAKEHIIKGWECAQPDNFIQPFAEHHGLLCGLIETCLKKDYPREYDAIIEATNHFVQGWRKFHNDVAHRHIAIGLTTTEFAISMLASRGWSNQEIADYMELSLHTVKRYISVVYQKLAITSRAELKKYMH